MWQKGGRRSIVGKQTGGKKKASWADRSASTVRQKTEDLFGQSKKKKGGWECFTTEHPAYKNKWKIHSAAQNAT